MVQNALIDHRVLHNWCSELVLVNFLKLHSLKQTSFLLVFVLDPSELIHQVFLERLLLNRAMMPFSLLIFLWRLPINLHYRDLSISIVPHEALLCVPIAILLFDSLSRLLVQ